MSGRFRAGFGFWFFVEHIFESSDDGFVFFVKVLGEEVSGVGEPGESRGEEVAGFVEARLRRVEVLVIGGGQVPGQGDGGDFAGVVDGDSGEGARDLAVLEDHLIVGQAESFLPVGEGGLESFEVLGGCFHRG